MGEFDSFLKRRMMTESGWQYFCRICGDYKNESEFYRRRTSPFKMDTRCKLHYTKRDTDDDKEMDYLKLAPLREEDFKQTQRVLQMLGYEFGEGSEPIHIQFNKKHNL